MNTITAKQFIATVFPKTTILSDGLPTVVIAEDYFCQRQQKNKTSLRGQHPNSHNMPYGMAPTYFCVSTVDPQPGAYMVKRTMEHIRYAHVLICDDVGTKAAASGIPPSYRMQTSKGNFQEGYLIHPYDVGTPDGAAYYDSILYSLAQAGLNDPGCRSAARIVRLPGSLHRTGFIARIKRKHWHPERVWKLEELAAAFDIPLVEPRIRKASKPGEHTLLGTVTDPVFLWLVEKGLAGVERGGWVSVVCPEVARHTDGEQGADTSTAYSPDGFITEGRAFKCLHGSCIEAGYGLEGFLSWVTSQGGPNVGSFAAGEDLGKLLRERGFSQ